jgi:hypothetical protein
VNVIDLEIEQQRAVLESYGALAPHPRDFTDRRLQPLRATGLLIGHAKFLELMAGCSQGTTFEVLQHGQYRGLTLYRVTGTENAHLLKVIGERDPEML